MKPFDARFRAMPSECDSRSGVPMITTSLFDERERVEVRTIASLADLETMAAEIAKALGLPCVVWIGAATKGARKPAGFDAEARRLASKFYGGAS